MKRPLSPEEVIKSIYKISTTHYQGGDLSPGVKGAMTGIIQSLLGSRSRRQSLLYRIFPAKWADVKSVSTNDILPNQWYALQRWIEPQKEEPPGTSWYGSPNFIAEVAMIMGQSDFKEGQEHLDPDNNQFEEFCAGRFGCIPVMVCGHESDKLTALWNPFCSLCAEGGQNKEAYTILADQSIMELADVNR